MFCYGTLGWTVEEVLSKHDRNNSGCLDFCEWAWFYRCASTLHGWGPATPDIITNLFIKADLIEEENCCLSLEELHKIIASLGGLKDSPIGPDFSPIQPPFAGEDPTMVVVEQAESINAML